MIENKEKLLLELPIGEALKIYLRRLCIFLSVIIANLIFLAICLLIFWLRRSSLILFCVVIGVMIILCLFFAVRQYLKEKKADEQLKSFLKVSEEKHIYVYSCLSSQPFIIIIIIALVLLIIGVATSLI